MFRHSYGVHQTSKSLLQNFFNNRIVTRDLSTSLCTRFPAATQTPTHSLRLENSIVCERFGRRTALVMVLACGILWALQMISNGLGATKRDCTTDIDPWMLGTMNEVVPVEFRCWPFERQHIAQCSGEMREVKQDMWLIGWNFDDW